jgi:hypothetical protein
MRIFGFEITRVRSTRAVEGTVWFGIHQPPIRLVDLDVNQLRQELATIHGHLRDGGVVQMNTRDQHQRIQYLPAAIGQGSCISTEPPRVFCFESDEPQVLRRNRSKE